MKFFWMIFLIFIAVVAVESLPAKNKFQKQNQNKKQCPNICTADYSPVCAADVNDSKSTPRLFGNKCVLSTHNCENNSNLVAVDMNKCKASGGIRLS